MSIRPIVRPIQTTQVTQASQTSVGVNQPVTQTSQPQAVGVSRPIVRPVSTQAIQATQPIQSVIQPAVVRPPTTQTTQTVQVTQPVARPAPTQTSQPAIIRPQATQTTQATQASQTITRPVIVRPPPTQISQVGQPAQPIQPTQPVIVRPLPTQTTQPVIRPVAIQPAQPIQPPQPAQPIQFAPSLAFLAGPTAIVTTPAIDRLRKVWAGTPEEYFQLEGLQYPDGTPILATANADVLSVLGDMLTSLPFSKVREFLQEVKSSRDIVLNRPEYKKFQQHENREIFLANQKPVAVEGIAVCAKCGSKKVTVIQVQNRSGDEGMTTKFTCADTGCGHKWNVG